MRIGALALERRALILELDVNPLMVYAVGQGVVAADALIRLDAPMDAAGARERRGGMSEVLHIRRDGAVLEVVLDRPKANAIDAATSRAMGQAFAAFRDDPELRVAIVTGAGDRFFSAGWDLKAAAAGETPDADFGVGGFGGLQELPGLDKPVIAAVGGMAVGGGFELALSCDLIIAATHARFALPEIKAGQLADAATIKLPRRIPHHIAMELLLTGRWLDALEAKHWGLVNEIVAAQDLLPRAREHRGAARLRAAARVRRDQGGGPRERASAHPGRVRSDHREAPALGPGALRERGCQGGCPRLRREAPAGLEGPLRRLCLKPRSRAPRHRGSP